MKPKCRYTVEEMRVTIRYLTPLFDVVRVVDPTDTAVLLLKENGTVERKPYTCFQVWNRDCRCKNCTSMQTMTGSCQRTKYEFIQDSIFYMVSQPLQLLEGERVHHIVLEIVSHVSDQLLKQENGEPLTEHLGTIQEKLYRDDLTKAFNRRYLNEFRFLHRNTSGSDRRLGLILMDLREFKAINDTQGHLAGDQVLKEVARLLNSRVRSQDSVIRFGGDEFVVILLNCDEDVVRRKIQDLRAVLETVAQADFGYAYTDDFRADQDVLLRMLEQADQQMYREKKEGRRQNDN